MYRVQYITHCTFFVKFVQASLTLSLELLFSSTEFLLAVDIFRISYLQTDLIRPVLVLYLEQLLELLPFQLLWH